MFNKLLKTKMVFVIIFIAFLLSSCTKVENQECQRIYFTLTELQSGCHWEYQYEDGCIKGREEVCCDCSIESEKLKTCLDEMHKFKTNTDYYYSERVVINEEIEQLAKRNTAAVKGIPSQKEAAIIGNYNFIKNNIAYSLESVETINAQPSIKTLRLGSGKCDEQSALLISLLRSIGIEAFFYLIPAEDHMAVFINGTALPNEYFDLTCLSCNATTFPSHFNLTNARILDFYEDASKDKIITIA